ncbi:hypothetical protein M569_03041 [Genlisea aurea]|uniref:Uncharacterized protein n=1 Tax=Genlisea aurea TaxID=192259 RepID=S8CXL4_9LAMI|nr:hypothetical protein M569_03041 [Genlisea aurea]
MKTAIPISDYRRFLWPHAGPFAAYPTNLKEEKVPQLFFAAPLFWDFFFRVCVDMKKQTKGQRGWVEIPCLGCTGLLLSCRRLVLRKWLNLATSESDYSADTDRDSDFSEPETSELTRASVFQSQRLDRIHADPENGKNSDSDEMI